MTVFPETPARSLPTKIQLDVYHSFKVLRLDTIAISKQFRISESFAAALLHAEQDRRLAEKQAGG